MDINIRAEIREVLKTCEDVPRTEVPRRAVLALNHAMKKVANLAKVEVGAGMGLDPALVRKSLRVLRAKVGRLQASVKTKGRPIPLFAFQGTHQTEAGVVSNAYGMRREFKHAFFARMKSGHNGVYRRVVLGGRRVGRLKINELFGPSIPEQFVISMVDAQIDARAAQLYLREFSRLMRLGSRLSLKGGSFRGK